MATLKKAGMLAMAFGMALAGCTYFDLGEPIEEWQPSQGVLTVTGLEDGSHYEAEVYDYPDDDIADDDDLNDIMSQFELAAIGLGTVGNGTLELTLLVPPEGEFFIADGDFLVVIKVAKTDSAPLMYKAAVPFSGGSATVEYDDMETAIVEPSDPNDPNNPNGPDVTSYTVTFHTNGGTPANFTQTTADGGKVARPDPDPTREGHTFGGWFTNAPGTGAAWDFDKDTVTTDLHLYAKWTRNTYTVTFDTDDDEHTPAPLENVQYEGKITAPAITKTGYTLDGWYKENTKTNKWDFGKDTVKENITLYGTWTRNTYTVTFSLNYTGATGTAPVSPPIAHGGKITEPTTEPERTGWTFGGWFLDEAGTAWNFETDTVTENITLYAKWIKNPVVTFFVDGVFNSAVDVPPGSKVDMPNLAAKADHDFDGWYTSTAYTTKWNFDSPVTENINLYAKWTQIKYTVTFNTGAGGSIVPALEVPHGSAATKPANPTRTDCDFDNWYAANADTPYNFNSTVTADIVLYAKWKPRTFAAAIVCMAETANSTSANYTLPSGNETYTAAITPLTTANSPASVVIDGGGRVVTGSANTFRVGSGVTLTLKNITFKTLPLSVSAGGKLVLDTGAVVRESAWAGITVSGTSSAAKGTLEMKAGALVTDNNTSGIMLENNSVLTMTGGEVSDNSNTDDGGGVLIKSGIFTMSGGTISGNYAGISGGGVCLEGTGVFTMSGGTISDNYADYGGGVAFENEFYMSGGFINDNGAEWSGGGVIARAESTFNMTGGEITGNRVDRLDYAAAYGYSGGLYLEGGTLTGNPQIGGTNPGTGRGWIHGNTPTDRN